MMVDDISRQIQEAPYVQVVSQLATVLRYIHDGKIQERSVDVTGF